MQRPSENNDKRFGAPHTSPYAMLDLITVNDTVTFPSATTISQRWTHALTNVPDIHHTTDTRTTRITPLALSKLRFRQHRLQAITNRHHPILSATALPQYYTNPWSLNNSPILITKLHSRPIPAIDLAKFESHIHSIKPCLHLFNEITVLFQRLDTFATARFPPCPPSPPWAIHVARRLVADGIATPHDPGSIAPGLLNVTPEKLDTTTPRLRILTDTLWLNCQPPLNNIEPLTRLIRTIPQLYRMIALLNTNYNTALWAASVDLEKSFYQVPIRHSARPLFGFCCYDESGNLQGFSMTRLAMGYVDAVDILHRITIIISIITVRHPLFMGSAPPDHMLWTSTWTTRRFSRHHKRRHLRSTTLSSSCQAHSV